jgi:hypothetical protein
VEKYSVLAPLFSLEPSSPGVCGKWGNERTEESAAKTMLFSMIHTGRSALKSAIRAVEKKRGRTEDEEKDTEMGIRLLSRQKPEEQQLQSPEFVMFDSSDDLKVQAWKYGSSSFSNE